jgi:anti-sigma factor RsiW
MTHRQPTTTHAEHDLLLVAALADREPDGEEAGRGRAQIAACTECAALHAELVSLASATRALPSASRPRDFRLRPADAERLRPNLVRRILGSFGTARDGFSRPLAMGLTTLGLAGLLIGVVPGALPAGGTGGAGATLETVGQAVDDDFRSMGAASAAPGAVAVPAPSGDQATDGNEDAAGASAAPTAQQQRDLGGRGGGVMIAGEPDPEIALAPDSSGVSQLVVVSGSLLIVGLGLFALRWSSRRFGG